MWVRIPPGVLIIALIVRKLTMKVIDIVQEYGGYTVVCHWHNRCQLVQHFDTLEEAASSADEHEWVHEDYDRDRES